MVENCRVEITVGRLRINVVYLLPDLFDAIDQFLAERLSSLLGPSFLGDQFVQKMQLIPLQFTRI